LLSILLLLVAAVAEQVIPHQIKAQVVEVVVYLLVMQALLLALHIL
jgi:hypothetical protein